MKINEFIENFANIFDDIEAGALQPETKFREMEDWSSIMALELIAMADEEYQVPLSGDDIKNSKTIEDLFQVIIKKLESN